MLTIRLMRFGRKHQPFFRLVVVPKRGKPDRAKYVEQIGWVDPLQHKKEVNAERVKYWMSQGTQPSDTAWNLFVKAGIVPGEKRPVHARGVTDAKIETPTTVPTVTESQEGVSKAIREALSVQEAAVEKPEVSGEEEKTPEINEAIDTEKKE